MRTSEWSSDVRPSVLHHPAATKPGVAGPSLAAPPLKRRGDLCPLPTPKPTPPPAYNPAQSSSRWRAIASDGGAMKGRSEEHTSELQSLMRISYAVFCLKKKKLPT